VSDETEVAIPEERPRVQWPLEPGRAIAIPVAMRDILPWTKRDCKQCVGRGVITRILATSYNKSTGFTTLAKADYTRRNELCGCGIRRFRKVQKTHVGNNGQLYAIEPWVAVSAETVMEAIKAAEEQAAKEQAEAASVERTSAPEVPKEEP
jgi:hypothetical protein